MQKLIVIPLVALSTVIGCGEQQSLSLFNKNGSNTDDSSLSKTKTIEVVPDWVGKYQGTTPCMGCTSRCEDCPGMSVDVQLNSDQTFVLNRISLSGHNEIETVKGHFKFNDHDSKIIELSGVAKRNLILIDLEHQLLEIREDMTANEFVEFEDFSLNRSS